MAAGGLELPHLDGVEHRFVEVGGNRLHVAIAGAGEPLLLLHGFPQHWWEWQHVIPQLSERYQVIAPDLRGCGWSDAPAGRYDKEALADDVIGILDALGLDRVRIIGHDWGGYVAFLLCIRAPERVSQYFAINTAHPCLVIDRRLPPLLWRFWYQAVIAAPLLGRRLLGDPKQRFLRFLLRWVSPRPDAWSEADSHAYLGQFQDPARARAGVMTYRTFMTREFLPLVRGRYKSARVPTPILFVHGTDDPVIRPDFLRHSGEFEDMRMEFVEGIGHFIADERPDLVLDRAEAFFAQAPVSTVPEA